MTKYATNIRKRWVTLKRIIHDYNYWKESKDSKPIHTHAHAHSKQRNIRERRVTIKRIIQMLKLLKDLSILKNHKIYFL